MFETSQDILNWALAVGAFAALAGLAFVFIYTAKILRQIYKVMTTVEGAFEAVRGIFDSIGKKISDTSSLGKFAVDVIKLVGDVKDVREEFSGKSTKRKKRSTKKSTK